MAKLEKLGKKGNTKKIKITVIKLIIKLITA